IGSNQNASFLRKERIMAITDLTGQRFDRLVALKRIGHKWLCRCDCGKETLINTGHLKRRRKTQSCGCMKNHPSLFTTHGHSYSAIYRVWCGMIGRCLTPTAGGYKNYGGRGITVCERWRNSFAAFLDDMGPRPSSKHSIDRFPDKNGNYEP